MKQARDRRRSSKPPKVVHLEAGARGRNTDIVYHLLSQAKRPLSAYDMLSAIRSDRNVSPVSVYRALNQLIAAGRVHRLESLNAYVTCRHSHEASRANIFSICDKCGSTNEFPAPDFLSAVRAQTDVQDFRVTSVCFELHGECRSCRSDTSPLGNSQNPT